MIDREVHRRRRRRRLAYLGVFLVVLLAAGATSLYQRAGRPLVALPEVPAAFQDAASDALGRAGYAPLGRLAWASARPEWRAAGSYRLFFAAATPAGAADLYAVDVQADPVEKIGLLGTPRRLTDTPDGAESAPVAAGDWLAFTTSVGGYCQSVSFLSLTDQQEARTFIFDQPAQDVELAWEGARLTVDATVGGRPTRWSVAPAAGAVEPASGLTYVPAARGEMPLIPRLVSRIRELPGVGPEKIAFLENVFFTLVDWVTRLFHPPVVVQATVTPAPAVVQAPATTPAPPAPTPTAPATATPMPTPASAATAVTPTAPATPTASPSPTPAGQELKAGVVWRGSVQPDPQRPYANAEIIDLDLSQLQIRMMPGTYEPRPTTGLIGSGVIPAEEWPALVAAFNGGFAAMHGHFGMMVERKVYLPARDGIATLAVYEDGSIRMGTWGKDLRQTPDMVSYRQNCPPLIENGVITAETGKLTLWGLSISNQVYLYRSGLGITKDGRLLYVAGKPLSAYTLARALQMAGAEYAMQLDVDEFHVVFITYDVQQAAAGAKATVAGHKLRADMRGYESFFLQPFQLDFFYLTRRPERLARAVRLEATPEPAASAPAPAAGDLPGQIAFASTRDGNWDIYAMPAGRPTEARRLTDHPADDLYPTWSPDGQRLAFSTRRDGNAEIYTLDIATSSLQRLTRQPSEEWAPAWSPDGTLLAYQSDRNGQSDIYVIAADGSGEKRITQEQGNHEAPHWSPDGKRFVFDSDLDVSEAVHASINLYIMEADGSNPRRLYSGAESPAWSPDGTKIAFTVRWGGRWQVVLINADGSGARQLTAGAYDARYPAWSPDGQWIAFAGNEAGHFEIYVVPAAGGAPQRLTFGSGDSSQPAWGP